MSIFFLVFVGTYLSIFLKGFQHKNVIHNMYVNTAITSYAMNVLDVLLIGSYAKMFVDGNWWYAFISGTAAALGMISSMYVHNRYFSKTSKPVKEKVIG